MPLTTRDRKFLTTVNHLKLYLLILAIATLLYLLFVPSDDMRAPTAVIGLALCGVFWLTQRLLSFISLLDLELTRIVNTLKRTLPEHEFKEFSQRR